MKYSIILRITSPGRQTSSMHDFRDLSVALSWMHRTIGNYVCAQFEVLGSGPYWASLQHAGQTVTVQCISLEGRSL